MSRMRRRISLADLILIGLLALGIGAGLAAQGDSGRGNRALVQIDGETRKRINLYRDGSYSVDGPAGTSRIEVSDGRIRVVEAPCRRKLCIRRGWLDSTGATTTCLPNRLHIRVEGDESGYDALNY